MEAYSFTCSICGEGSRDLCVFCTKDVCVNHLCERCHRCSDCCTCEMPRSRIAAKDLAVTGDPDPLSEPIPVPDS